MRKLDAKYGRGFFDTLNATGDVPAGSRIAKASNTALAYRNKSRQLAYSAGGSLESGAVNVSGTMPSRDGELVDAVNGLRREVADLRDGLGGQIAANSAPWPSKRDFIRDVLEASRGR